MTHWKALFTFGLLTIGTMGHAGDRGTLLETLNDNPQLSTIVTAIEAADLVDTLAGDGPFTVFAPTDAAFDAMPESILNVLLLPENAERLADILLYHVDDRKLTTHHLIYGPEHYRTMLEDSQLCITREDIVTIADGSGDLANVTQADIKTSNGVIHIIDKVLQPGDKPRCHM